MSGLSFTVTSATAARVYYVAVAVNSVSFVAGQGVRLNYTIVAATPSASATPPASVSGSGTAAATASSTATASASGITQSPTATATQSRSGTPPGTPSSTLTSTQTGSVPATPSQTASATRTRSQTPSRSGTPTPTGTNDPNCLGQVAWTAVLAGPQGQFNGSISSQPYGNGGAWASDDALWPSDATCSDDYDSYPLPTAYARVFALDLRPTDGSDFVPGGVMEISSCGSSFDTVILASTGCPSSAARFAGPDGGGCAAWNDDDLSGQCTYSPYGGANGGDVSADDDSYAGWISSSRVTVPIDPGAYPQVFVILAVSEYTLDVGGRAFGGGNYSLSWRWLPASATPSGSATQSPSASPSESLTGSFTPSISVTPTRSLTRGANASVSPSRTFSPTRSLSRTRSPNVTPSISLSRSFSQTGMPTPTRTPLVTRTGTATPTATGSQWCGVGNVAFNGQLTGLSGTFASDTSVRPWSGTGVSSFTGNSITVISDDAGTTNIEVPVGNKHLLALDLGITVPPGGRIVVSLCSNPLFDSLMFMGEW